MCCRRGQSQHLRDLRCYGQAPQCVLSWVNVPRRTTAHHRPRLSLRAHASPRRVRSHGPALQAPIPMPSSGTGFLSRRRVMPCSIPRAQRNAALAACAWCSISRAASGGWGNRSFRAESGGSTMPSRPQQGFAVQRTVHDGRSRKLLIYWQFSAATARFCTKRTITP